jgi:hypothetical protein
MIYFEKMGTDRSVSISNTAFISPFCLMLFGSKMKVLHIQRKVMIDDWMEISVAAKTGVIFREVHDHLSDILAAVFENSHSLQNEVANRKASDVVDCIVNLLCNDQQLTK